MEKYPSFCDACCLVEMNQGGSRYPIHFEPPDYYFSDQLQYIVINAFPKAKKIANDIYAFSIDTHMCYAYNFTYNNTPYSIILLSLIPCPYIFISFLRDIKKSIDSEDVEIDPECRLTLIWSTIKSWRFVNQFEATITFSNRPFTATFDLQLQNYGHFSPFKYFDFDTEYLFIWRAILTGRRVIIISNNRCTPTDMHEAAFGLASLSGPFPYRENILIIPNPADPRLRDRNILRKSKIICVPKFPKALQQNDYSAILTIYKNNRPSYLISEQIDIRNRRVYRIVTYLLKRNLIVDPYSDLIESDFIDDDLNEIITENTMNLTLNFEQFRDLQNSTSFKIWRRATTIRDDFRDIFLSTLPEVALSGKNEETLKKCLEFIHTIMEIFRDDEHVMYVARRHEKLINKVLRGEKIKLPKFERTTFHKTKVQTDKEKLNKLICEVSEDIIDAQCEEKAKSDVNSELNTITNFLTDEKENGKELLDNKENYSKNIK
ncbi:hypothetical protein TRFO_03663 [Tritrichomonas foetus]|uniref:UDENN domain-containing protein n=1 Tax=Tritrichomonas foetus TaxID=1144522 RepID=A0A1J4KMT4_9EUKA|nr:hypothetical protein TRFO_03663 [Tritrichomonas foetus]|eukprot:OHT12625.1 hypothetical protein TRFO_03663 [Tritrichomonas foetus]